MILDSCVIVLPKLLFIYPVSLPFSLHLILCIIFLTCIWKFPVVDLKITYSG